MTIGIDVACADGTHFTSFNTIALVIGVAGILAWLGVIRSVYLFAGIGREELERRLGLIGGFLLVGMLVEFMVSTVSLEVYCAGDDPAPLYSHIGVAIAASFLAAGGTAWLERSGAT